MDNNCHIPDLVQAFSNEENGRSNHVNNGPGLQRIVESGNQKRNNLVPIYKYNERTEPCFIALNLSLVWQSHQILLYLQRCVNKTDIIDNIVKIWVQQSSLYHNPKTKKSVCLYVLEFSVTSICTELVHNFIKGPAEDQLRMRAFLAVLKTHLLAWNILSAVWIWYLL